MSEEGGEGPGYKYVDLSGAGAAEEEERAGCLDILIATSGFGCALALRGIILLAGLAAILLFLYLTGATGSHHKAPTHHHAALPVLRQRHDGRPFVLLDFLDLEEQFGR